MVLPRAWFDAERCAKGINALRHYRREWNEAAQTWRSSPGARQRAADISRPSSIGSGQRLRYLCLGVREDRPRQIALKAAQQGQGVVSVSGPGWTSWLWQQHAEAQWRAEMERLERAAQGAEVMKKWEAIVARHGWSQEEAMTYWHDWLTGPPGLFG
jgi:hypothetical protein